MSNEYKPNSLAGTSQTLTGTTTDAYVALTIMCQGYKNPIAFLKNTHAGNTLIFKVDGYASPSANARPYVLLAATDLGPTDTARILLPDGYYQINVSVITKTTPNHATYAFDYEMTGA